MRRVLPLLLALCLLAGCSQPEPTTGASAIDLGSAVAESQPADFSDALTPLSGELDPEGLEAYLSSAYGLDRADWTDAVAAYAQGLQAFELAVIRLADGVPCEYSQTLEFPGAGLPELRWKRENARLSAEIVSGNDRRQIRILVRDPVIPPSEYEETGALVREFTRKLKQWRMP